MGADRVLIEGQLRMRQAENELARAEYMGPMAIFEAFKTWDGLGKKLKKNFKEPMERITDNGSALSQKDYDQALDTIGGENYDLYVNSEDPADQTKAMENAKKINAEYTKYNDIVTGFADAYQNNGVSKAMEDDPAGLALIEYFDMDGPPKLYTRDCPEDEPDCDYKDQLGILFPDFEAMEYTENRLNEVNQQIANLDTAISNGEASDADYVHLERLKEKQQVLIAANNEKPTTWKSLQWLRQTTDYWKRDVSTPKIVQTYADQAFQFGLTNNPDDNIPFEEAKFRQLLKDNIFGGETPSKIHSMIHDPMIGGNVFKNDFYNMIKNGTYEQLGIDPALIVDPTPGVDKNNDGKDDNTGEPIGISDSDAELIGKSVLKDQEAAKGYLEEYLMGHFRNNFNMGVEKNRKPVLDDDDDDDDDDKIDVVEKRKNREEYIPISVRYKKDSL